MLQNVNGFSHFPTLSLLPPNQYHGLSILSGVGLGFFFLKVLLPHCNNITAAPLVLAHMGPVVTPGLSKSVP